MSGGCGGAEIAEGPAVPDSARGVPYLAGGRPCFAVGVLVLLVEVLASLVGIPALPNFQALLEGVPYSSMTLQFVSIRPESQRPCSTEEVAFC